MAILKATLQVFKVDETDYPNAAAAQADFDLVTNLAVKRMIAMGVIQQGKTTRKKPLVPGSTAMLLGASFPETLEEMSAGQKQLLAEVEGEMRLRRYAREQHRYEAEKTAGDAAEAAVSGMPIG